MPMPGPLSYGLQTKKQLLGTDEDPITLTATYANNEAEFITSGVAMITFYIGYESSTAGNSLQIRIEGSPTAGDPSVTPRFYQDISTSVTGAVAGISLVEYDYVSTGNTPVFFRLSFPCADASVRISLKETVEAGAAGVANLNALIGPNN